MRSRRRWRLRWWRGGADMPVRCFLCCRCRQMVRAGSRRLERTFWGEDWWLLWTGGAMRGVERLADDMLFSLAWALTRQYRLDIPTTAYLSPGSRSSSLSCNRFTRSLRSLSISSFPPGNGKYSTSNPSPWKRAMMLGSKSCVSDVT